MWLITFSGIDARFHVMSRTGVTVTRVLLALLLFLPVMVGAVYTVVSGTDLTSTSVGDEAADTAAPGEARREIRGGGDLVAARRAAGEAETQAGFLVAGTGELSDGAGELADGSRRLSEGATDAVNGSQQLTDGLIQLQAGTGQLGDGATRVADGVSRAVEQIEALPGARDELLRILDDVDATLAKSDHPEAPKLRMELVNLRVEVVNFRIAPEMLGQLNELRDGSREVANQLSTPGQPFHDGVYSAAAGSRSLTSGLRELNEGTQALQSGVDEIRDGAERIRSMAEANEKKVDAIQAGLPARSAAGTVPGASEQAAAQLDTGVGPGPMDALFAALLVWLAGTSLWLLSRLSPAPAGVRSRVFGAPGLAVAGIAAVGAVFVATVARPAGSVALTGAILVVALTAVAAAVSGRAVIGVLGATVGRIALVLGMIVQVGVLGHVFSGVSAGEEPTAFWRSLTAVMPAAYPAGALADFGAGGSGPVLWTAVAVLGALVVMGAVVGRFVPTVDRHSQSMSGAPGEAHDDPAAVTAGHRPSDDPTATIPAVTDDPPER